MAKYGKKAQEKIHKNLHEHKHSGKFKSRKQAIAAGINQAREAGGKVPKRK
jgi:hypothetical protein